MKRNLLIIVSILMFMATAYLPAMAAIDKTHLAQPEGLWIPLRQAALERRKALPLPSAVESLMWAKNMVAFDARPDMPLIAIVIDDMGVDRKRSAAMIESMPSEVTMAYIPYATDVATQVKVARRDGHEIVVHLPMQPESKTIDPGADYLGVDFSPEELRARIKKNLSAFKSYAGVNNHMGSKFTQDKIGVNILMEEINAHGLYFLDSRTIASSVAEEIARKHGVPTSYRDVFLDVQETLSFTRKALVKLEGVARREGTAIAIGHPKDMTLAGLKEWIPTLEAKGFQLAPLSAVIRHRQKGTVIKKNVAKVNIPKVDIGMCEVP